MLDTGIFDAKPGQGTDTVADLRAIVESLDIIGTKTRNGLLHKLEEAEQALARSSIKVAVNKLRDFINQVNAQSGQAIEESDAALLIAYAENLITIMGRCLPPA